jgi:hypothetical protein
VSEEDVVRDDDLRRSLVDCLSKRLINLESILHTSLFGLLISTTSGVLFGVYNVTRGEGGTTVSPQGVVIIAGFLYFFLSGYYYYMLLLFAGTTRTIMEMAKGKERQEELQNLWRYFNWRPTFELWLPAIFPLLFSVLSIAGLSIVFRGRIFGAGLNLAVYGLTFSLQAGAFLSVIVVPWRRWVRYLKRNMPDIDL